MNLKYSFNFNRETLELLEIAESKAPEYVKLLF